MNYLILNPSDIYYLTGVRSHDAGEILILQGTEYGVPSTSYGEKSGIIFCDPRTSALFDAEKYEIIDDRKKWEARFAGFSELATDPDFLTQTLREKIEKYGVKLTTEKSPITEKRIVKTSEEIEILKISQSLNKKVYEMILPFLVPGVTERDIARKIQILQLELGADGPSFSPIVAFAENSAIPHHSPTDRILQSDDIILLDMGLIYGGYCSDMTRMVVQDETSQEAREIALLVTRVTNEIIAYAKAGMTVKHLDEKAREMLGTYEPYFTHSLGHGVGIDIHESPSLSSRSDEILEPGMVITIEPGIYLAGKYGARYEEMVVVTEGGAELL